VAREDRVQLRERRVVEPHVEAADDVVQMGDGDRPDDRAVTPARARTVRSRRPPPWANRRPMTFSDQSPPDCSP
jgi:hypothetical protein